MDLAKVHDLLKRIRNPKLSFFAYSRIPFLQF